MQKNCFSMFSTLSNVWWRGFYPGPEGVSSQSVKRRDQPDLDNCWTIVSRTLLNPNSAITMFGGSVFSSAIFHDGSFTRCDGLSCNANDLSNLDFKRIWFGSWLILFHFIWSHWIWSEVRSDLIPGPFWYVFFRSDLILSDVEKYFFRKFGEILKNTLNLSLGCI